MTGLEWLQVFNVISYQTVAAVDEGNVLEAVALGSAFHF